MRWLFLFVLSLNLVYLGLEMSKSSTADDVDVPALKNVKTIVLLSELKQQQSGSAEAEQVATIVDDAPAEAPSAERIVAGDGNGVQEAVVAQQVAEDKPEAMSEPVEQANAERVTTETVASAESAKPVPEPAIEVAQSASCFTLGPFRDLAELRGLIREIKSYVVEADFRARKEKERTLYWVYVKPEKNRHQAIATGKRLKAKKIKDFYVIRDGEKINGLSLGHFRSKKGAYGLAKKVRKLGFDVIVEPVYRTYTLYWLDYQLAAGVRIPESIFEKYMQPSKKQKVSRLSRDCSA